MPEKELGEIIDEVSESKDSVELSFLSPAVNKILSEPRNHEYRLILIRKLMRIDSHRPFLKSSEVVEEMNKMNELSVKVEIVSDTDVTLLNSVIDKIQASRDRLTYLLNKIELEYRLLTSTYKHLVDIWVGYFSTGKSADKRKSEAEFILDFLHDDVEDRQTLYSLASNTLRNMGSKMESVSRKFSIISHAHKVSGSYYSNEGLPQQSNIYNKNYEYRVSESDDSERFDPTEGKTGWEAVPMTKNLSVQYASEEIEEIDESENLIGDNLFEEDGLDKFI